VCRSKLQPAWGLHRVEFAQSGINFAQRREVLITHTGTPTSPRVAAISPEVKIKSASFARPFAEMVSVASTLTSFAHPQSLNTSSREFFKNKDVPRPLPQTVRTLPLDSTALLVDALL